MSEDTSTPVRRFAERWSLFAGCVLVWQWVTAVVGSPYFPTPLTIARQAGHLWFSGPAAHLLLTGDVFDDILPSLARVLAGWGVAVVIGVAAGLALGRSPVAADYCRGLLGFARVVPPSVLVPVFLVLFHVGPRMEIATIALGTVWPVLLGTEEGARSIDPLRMDTAQVFRIPWYQRTLGVIVPASAPGIFAGLRVSLSVAFILMVVAELVGSTSGIGHQLLFTQGNADLPGMWAWIVLVGALGYLCTSVLGAVEHRALRWQRGAADCAEED
jgi:ABC-type nitrate/sulfonate/bicarbonate transport system permease component